MQPTPAPAKRLCSRVDTASLRQAGTVQLCQSECSCPIQALPTQLPAQPGSSNFKCPREPAPLPSTAARGNSRHRQPAPAASTEIQQQQLLKDSQQQQLLRYTAHGRRATMHTAAAQPGGRQAVFCAHQRRSWHHVIMRRGSTTSACQLKTLHLKPRRR